MKISYTTVPGNLSLSNGYGLAGYHMCKALNELGHTVPFADGDCPVEISFCQPDYTEWSNEDAYHIQYTPWESTDLPKGWVESFNESNEVWTPSPLIAKWYKEAGVVRPIYVYEHGVNHEYKPVRRRRIGRLNFLHVGEPAPRKGGQMAMEAFREAFGDRTDVHLTIKAWGSSHVRGMKGKHIVGTPHGRFKNITTISQDIPEHELITLFHSHQALVYPGWGEGFGLIPLQALASGMPTICTGAWAPYERFLLPELTLSSRLVDSPWPTIHPGKMFEPSYEELVAAYKYTDENFERVAGRAFRTSFDVHKAYDWNTLTENAFDRIVTRFS